MDLSWLGVNKSSVNDSSRSGESIQAQRTRIVLTRNVLESFSGPEVLRHESFHARTASAGLQRTILLASCRIVF